MRHVSTLAIPMLGALVMSTFAVGCASSVPLHTDRSTSAIRAAEEVGANSVPRASLHLQLAKEELGRAESMARNGDGEEAESMLTRAEVDAELAVALAREETEKSEGEAAVRRVHDLQRENQPEPQRNNRTNEKDLQ